MAANVRCSPVWRPNQGFRLSIGAIGADFAEV
jgi:hypothetical protein